MLTTAVIDQFWGLVQLSSPNECWLWRAKKNGRGYGIFLISGKESAAHRISYELAHGPVPDGLLVRHYRCANPNCVNPRHLTLGKPIADTSDETGQARELYGRHYKDRALTAADVVAMRTAHVEEGIRPNQLAITYDVSRYSVMRILRGRVWKPVTGGIDVYVPGPDEVRTWGVQHEPSSDDEHPC